MKNVVVACLFLAGLIVLAPTASAQQKIGFVDSQYILDNMPDYASVKQQIDRMAQNWQSELDKKQKDLDEEFKEYQARELLYTAEEKQRKRDEIVSAEEDLERLRTQYFGPEGELFTQQQNLVRPIQERIVKAIEEIARGDGYDYVFDKSGDFLFMYAREQHNLSDRVLRELGIDVDRKGSGSR